MKRVGVSQGLAYQQPMDDSGQEHHPMLLNDGRVVPKLPLPDATSYGTVFTLMSCNDIYFVCIFTVPEPSLFVIFASQG
jgi:hypothetical protein